MSFISARSTWTNFLFCKIGLKNDENHWIFGVGEYGISDGGALSGRRKQNGGF
jgi:hypothetical protein